MTVDPGDLMCASIAEGASSNWTISIAELDQGDQLQHGAGVRGTAGFRGVDR